MKSRNGFSAVAVLLIVLVLAVIGGVAYVYLPQTATQNNTGAAASSTASAPTTPAQTTAQTLAFKTVTNNTLNFSVNIPEEDHIGVDLVTGKPVNYQYAIEDASNQELPTSIVIQMNQGKIQTGAYSYETLYPFFITNKYYTPYIKPFTTETGLKGIIYNNPNPDPSQPSSAYGKIVTNIKEAVAIPYPISSTQQPDTSLNTQLKYPLIVISMAGTDATFTTQQQNLFMEVVNSFKFTGNGPSVDAPATTTPPVSSNTSTITLDATTKVAVVQAIMNGIDILSSNDAAKIRNYFLIELQNPDQQAPFKAMSDSQLLQTAAAGVANEGKPSADLATDPTAIWKVNGNTVTVTHKTYAKPNPAYPAIANLNVTYQAVYVNGAWQ